MFSTTYFSSGEFILDIIITISALMLFFLIIRAVLLWYWKIYEIVSYLEAINNNIVKLSEIIKKALPPSKDNKQADNNIQQEISKPENETSWNFKA